jgi:hypothetical protein
MSKIAIRVQLLRRTATLVSCLAVLSAILLSTAGAQGTVATLTISVVGPGSVRSVPPGAISCPPTCAVGVEIAASLALEAVPAGDSYLDAWEGECGGTFERCEIVVDGPTSVVAVFVTGSRRSALPIPLKVTRAGGGTVTSEPSGTIDCGTLCETAFSGGGSVTLRAIPDAAHAFAGWSGSCVGDGLCIVAVTERRDVSATFRSSVVPPGASVVTLRLRDPPPTDIGLVCCGTVRVTTFAGATVCAAEICSVTVPNGSTVILERVTGTLLRWEGSCVGSALRCVLVPESAADVTAHFLNGLPAEVSHAINVTRAGAGRVTSVPPGIDCGPTASCQAVFKGDVAVRLRATASQGSAFRGWSGDCGGTGICTLRADTGRAAIAVFKLARHRVAVSRSGRGAGAVSSNPQGIACPPDCVFEFPKSTAVELRAIPAPGSRFAGWHSGCAGLGACRFNVERQADVRAHFAVCAASRFDRFSVTPAKRPRRFVVRLRLAAQAGVRVVLLKNGRTIKQLMFRRQRAGLHVLGMRVPASTRAGQHRVQVGVRDLCGATKRLSLPVRIANA